jgi:hypothetical protein
MAQNVIPKSELLSVTMQLLRDRPRHKTLEDISEATGLPIPWLLSLTGGNPPESPGVDRIVVLYEHLSGFKLEVRR